MNIFEELAKFNNVKYYDEPHEYYINGKKLISGTSFIGLFKKKFDKNAQAIKYAKKHGLKVEDVLYDWDIRGEFSRTKGTLLHAFAENYWMNKSFPDNSKQYNGMFGDLIMSERLAYCKKLFLDFYNDAKRSLCPVALELVVGDEELGIAGMVDCLFWNKKSKQYEIWDYKTNKEINMRSKFGEYMLAPLNFLPECEFNAYSLQLSLYKYLIEKNTKIKIGKMYLIHIHEEQEKYNIIECAEYNSSIELMIDWYKSNQK